MSTKRSGYGILVSLVLAVGCHDGVASHDALPDLASTVDLAPTVDSAPTSDASSAPDLIDEPIGEVTLELLAGKMGGPGSLDEVGDKARLRMTGMVADGAGHLLFTQFNNPFWGKHPDTLRQVDLATGAVTTMAEWGVPVYGPLARNVDGMLAVGGACDDNAGHAYPNRMLVRMANGDIKTYGTNVCPQHIAAAPDGTFVYAAGGGPLYRLNLTTYESTTIATMPFLQDVVVDSKGDLVVVATVGLDHVIGRIALADGAFTSIAKVPTATALTLVDDDTLYFIGGAALHRMRLSDGENTVVASQPAIQLGAATDDAIFVSDGESIQRIAKSDGAITNVAGASFSWGTDDGVGDLARFDTTGPMISDGANLLYVVDGINRFDGRIRAIDLTTRATTTLIEKATPDSGIAYDNTGTLWYSDVSRRLQRRDLASGTTTEVALELTAWTRIDASHFLSASYYGLFAFDTTNNARTLLAGQADSAAPVEPMRDGVGAAARFSSVPWASAYDAATHTAYLAAAIASAPST